MITAPAAVAIDKAAAPYRTAGGVLRAVPTSGRRAGDNSIAVPANGRILPLEASR